jgi:hypothetical protein
MLNKMKKLLLISAIAMSGLFYNTANAQIRVHLGFNFGPRPVVVSAPAPEVYSEPAAYNDDYYYLPDVDAYYSVGEQCYYYNDGGAWVSAAYLPGAYRDYDWRSSRRFEIRAPRPYMHADFYRTRYNGASFAGRWNDRGYDRGYVVAQRDDRRFYGNRFEDHGYDRNRWNDRHFDNDRHSDRDNFHGRDGYGRDDHHGRF